MYLEGGIDRVILGSAAVNDRNLLCRAVELYGDRIIVGIDARNGKVSVSGWTSDSDIDYIDMAKECEKIGVNYRVGNILSSDMFYDDANSGMQWAKMGVLGVEMESAALYCNAARAGKKALCICTVSDSFIYPEENTTAEERQISFTKMMEIALNIAEE